MKTALIKIDVAAALLEWPVPKLAALKDGGDLVERGFAWVFNLANAADGARQDVRFWRPEVEARVQAMQTGTSALATKYNSYELDWVIPRIVPDRRGGLFNAGEVDQLFQLRPRTRIDLHAELPPAGMVNGSHVYARATLTKFLERRWLGAVSSRTATGKH